MAVARREITFVPGIHDVRSRAIARRIHPHVQGPIVVERKASIRSIQLERGDSEIEEDSLHGSGHLLAHESRELRQATASQAGSSPEPG